MSTHGGVSERGRRYPPADSTGGGVGYGRGSGLPGRATSGGVKHSLALNAALNDREREIAHYTQEHAHVFAADGTHVLTQRAVGRQQSIHFSDAQLARMPGTVFTHNHPRGNSFSPDDVRFAAEHGLAEMRAVTPKYRYVLTPPPGGWSAETWQHSIGPAYRRANAAVERTFRAAITARTMTVQSAEARHWHEVWTRVAAETGVRYQRVPWSAGRDRNPADEVPRAPLGPRVR